MSQSAMVVVSLNSGLELYASTAHMLLSREPCTSKTCIVAKICGSHRRTEFTLSRGKSTIKGMQQCDMIWARDERFIQQSILIGITHPAPICKVYLPHNLTEVQTVDAQWQSQIGAGEHGAKLLQSAHNLIFGQSPSLIAFGRAFLWRSIF